MGIFHGSREKSFIINKPTSSKYPVHFGAVSVDGVYEKKFQAHAGKAPDNLFFGKLQAWGMHTFDRVQEAFSRGQWCDGENASDFWRAVRTWAQKNGTVWLFGWKIWPSWCLLDGRKEIDEQRLILDIRVGEDPLPGCGGSPPRSTGCFIAENPPTIICLAVPGGGRIKIVDLANYGIEPEDFGVDGQAGALSATVHAIKEYIRLCTVYDLGSLQTTAASQAWYCYRRSHMAHLVTVHPLEKVLSLEQAAYYGGRCECVRLGRFKKKLYHLDVNSLYTSLGTFTLYPASLCATWSEEMGSKPPLNNHKYILIADVTIETKIPGWPTRESALHYPDKVPTRKSGRERIIYPIGKFRTALAGIELFAAIEAGVIRHWHRIQYYDPQPLMESWSCWALRMRASLKENGFSSLSRCAKKIMNSLPGKWGQRLKRWVDFSRASSDAHEETNVNDWFQEWGKHPNNGEITPYRTIAGQTQYQDREELSAVSCPSIAACWTASGRAFLYGAILNCGIEHVYYYDTDSLIIDEAGFLRMAMQGLLDQAKPGKWKLKEQSDDVEILGIRRYRFGKRWCVAGPFGGTVDGDGSPGEFLEHEGFGAQLWHRSVGDAVEIKRHAKWRKEYKHGVADNDGIVWPFIVGQPLTSQVAVVK